MHSSPIEEIKNRLDIVEVVSQYVKLQKTGANYKAPCPFHSEKSGSFFVSPAKQIWHCFGCSRGGDIFGFVKEIEGVEFGDALRILANRAGVELKRPTAEAAQLRTERERFYEICELAAKFFERQLEAGKAGGEAKNYLLSRGLSGPSVKAWRIGYAPDSWHGLTNFLAAAGYGSAEIEKAGLAVRSEIGSVHDRFRGRIMFPVFDFNAQIVGFGGRILRKKKEDDAKYINTPNTILYDKSRVLYGLDRAKVAIKKADACVLVEGYTDVIMSAQAGFANVVASSGTALTPFQLKILKRYTDNLVLGYDMDLAGDTANKRGIELAQAEGFNVSVVRPPFEGMDPADVISKDPAEWANALKKTKSILDFYFDNAFLRNDKKTPEGKKAIAAALLPAIRGIKNHIERTFWIQKLARDLEAREDDLREEMKKVRLTAFADAPQVETGAAKKSRRELLEERLLALILKYATNIELVQSDCEQFFSDEARAIVSVLRTGGEPGPDVSQKTRDYYNYLCLRADVEAVAEKDAAAEVRFLLKEIKKTLLKSNLETIAGKIKKAESANDEQAATAMKEEYNRAAMPIKELEGEV